MSGASNSRAAISPNLFAADRAKPLISATYENTRGFADLVFLFWRSLRPTRGQIAIRRMGIRHRGRGPQNKAGRRFLPLRERRLAGSRSDSGGQTGIQFATGDERPDRAAVTRSYGGGREAPGAEAGNRRRKGRRVLQVFHG